MNWTEISLMRSDDSNVMLQLREKSDVVPKNMFSSETIDRWIFHLLLGLVFFNPIPHTTTVKEACLNLSVLGAIYLLWIKGKPGFVVRTPLTIPLLAFSFWACLSVFWSLDRANTIHDVRSLLLEYVALTFLLVNFVTDKQRLLKLLNTVVYSTVGFAIYSICVFYFLHGHGFREKLVTGMTEVPVNWIGFFAVFSFLISMQFMLNGVSRARKIFSAFSALTVLVLVFFCQARSAVFALALSVIVYLVLQKNKKILLGFLIAIVIGLLLSPVTSRFKWENILQGPRLSIYYTAIEIVKDYPVTGIGFGGDIYAKKLDLNKYFQRVPGKITSSHYVYPDPHSMIFSVMVMVGLVGFVLFSWIIISFIVMCGRLIRSSENAFIRNWASCVLSALVGYLPIALLEPAFHQLSLLMFYTILSSAIVLWRIESMGACTLHRDFRGNFDQLPGTVQEKGEAHGIISG